MKKKRYTTRRAAPGIPLSRKPGTALHRHETKIPKDVAAFIAKHERTLGFTAKEFTAKLTSAGHSLYEMMTVEEKLRRRYPGILENLVGRLEFGPGSMPTLKRELRRLEKKFESEQAWIEEKRELLHELMSAHASPAKRGR